MYNVKYCFSPIVTEQEWEEVDVKVDEKITEYEEKIVYLEDKISDLESEKDAIVNNSKVY